MAKPTLSSLRGRVGRTGQAHFAVVNIKKTEFPTVCLPF
jgi:hypothetical protein